MAVAVGWVWSCQHHTASLDSIETLPHHGDHRPTGHVLDKSREECLLGEVTVVLLKKGLAGLHHLHGDQLESFVLEPLDDFTDYAPLDTIRLDHDESSLIIGHG